MGMQDIITTLHDFMVRWFTDADFRDNYDGDVEAALDDHGFDDVDADTLLQCLPLVAEDLPLADQRAVYEYMSSVDVDNVADVNSGSNFNVSQGGGPSGGYERGGYERGGHERGGHDGGHKGGGHHGGDDVAQHIYNIQNISETNNSYIDDRDVTTTVNALGDVDFDQVVASGDGAVAAGDDIDGVVNTGTNNGVIAGDDAEGVDVTNVNGDGNTVTGDVGSGAVIASGDDNIFASGSNVVDGDFQGQFVGGSVTSSNLIGDDAGVAAAGASAVTTGAVNVNGTQYNVDADDSAVHFGDGANVNDQSINVDIDDSFNTDNSTHLDVDVDDSFNTDNSTNDSYNTDTDVDVEVEDSLNTDNSTEIDDSFNKELEVDVEDSFNQDNSTDIDTDIDADVAVDDSFNTDNSVDDSDFIDAH